MHVRWYHAVPPTRNRRSISDDGYPRDLHAARRPSFPAARRDCRGRRNQRRGSGPMTLILLQTMIQSIGSTLNWIGFYVGVSALSGDRARRRRWAIGSALVFVAWLAAILLLAGNDFFRSDVRPPRIPM